MALIVGTSECLKDSMKVLSLINSSMIGDPMVVEGVGLGWGLPLAVESEIALTVAGFRGPVVFP